MTQEEVPAGVARLWRLPGGRRSGRLGRPAELDVDRVVQAAVALAERAGLGGVTLPKVAEALQVTPMSLYRYIGSKDELLVLMEDLGWGPAPRFEVSEGQWRSGLECWALAQRSMLQQHPWLVHIAISGPPRGPHLIAWMDAGLRSLCDTGLDWAAKVGVLMVVNGYVRQTELMAQQLTSGRGIAGVDHAQADHAQIGQDYWRDLALLVDAERYPDMAALVRSRPFETPAADMAAGLDDDFAFGLTLILDGIATTIDRAR